MVKEVIVLLVVSALLFISPQLAHSEETTIPEGIYQPTTTLSAQDLYDEAVLFRKKGQLLQAAELYRKILNAHPTLADYNAIEKELEAINLEIITTSYSSPQSLEYVVQAGDTLGKIARNNGTTVELIRLRNHLISDQIKSGQKLSLWAGPFEILIDKTRNKLTLKNAGSTIKIYAISTGKEQTTTPTGEFTITTRYTDPVWFHRGVVVPPGSPENYLGTRWLGFDKPGYGIHGTIFPELIGQSVSGGCVRMRNEDVEELYNLIPTGTKAVITQ